MHSLKFYIEYIKELFRSDARINAKYETPEREEENYTQGKKPLDTNRQQQWLKHTWGQLHYISSNYTYQFHLKNNRSNYKIPVPMAPTKHQFHFHLKNNNSNYIIPVPITMFNSISKYQYVNRANIDVLIANK